MIRAAGTGWGYGAVVTWATAVQLVGLALLAVGLGLLAVWLGVAVAGLGLLLFGIALEAGPSAFRPDGEKTG